MAYGCLTPMDAALSVGECDLTGKKGRENVRVLEGICVLIRDVGWALELPSETP